VTPTAKRPGRSRLRWVAAGVLTLVGLATGARRPDRVRAFVGRGIVIAVALLAVPGIVVFVRPSLWMGTFTDDAGIRAIGAQYFRIVGPTYPLLGASMIASFAFQGLGRATLPLVVMIVRVAAVLGAAIVCTGVFGLGEQAVFTTIAAGNVAGAVVLLAFLVRAL